jgi:3-hydroxybutyryl-CoA dehydrogenase
MGSGIAQVFAQHGFVTMLFDVNKEVLANAQTKIKKYSASSFEKITFTTSLNDCRADLIIEAIIENEKAKVALFNDLMALNALDTIFATNTSSLSVTAIAEKVSHPQQLAGMHFFNPAPLMKLIEIISTKYTTPTVIDFLTQLTKDCGKTPVLCNDSPGFIVNRVARPYYLEALYLAENFNVDFETVDKLAEASGFKMGPFRLMDLIGNDINYSVSCIVHEALGKPERLKPSSIQEQKVKEGKLGRKTGKGYYEYSGV